MVNGVLCGCGLWQHMFLSPCLRATVWRCSPAGSTGQTDLSCRTLCHRAFRQIFTHSPALKTIYIISNDFPLLLTRCFSLSLCLPSCFSSPWLTLARNHHCFDVLFEISALAIAPIMKVGVPMPVPAPRDRRRCVEFNTREVTAPGTWQERRLARQQYQAKGFGAAEGEGNGNWGYNNFLNFYAAQAMLTTRTRAANKSGRRRASPKVLKSFITSASVQLRDFAQIMFWLRGSVTCNYYRLHEGDREWKGAWHVMLRKIAKQLKATWPSFKSALSSVQAHKLL